jgi:hypothetical protein
MALIVPKPAYADEISEDDIKPTSRAVCGQGVVSKWALPSRVRAKLPPVARNISRVVRRGRRGRHRQLAETCRSMFAICPVQPRSVIRYASPQKS